MPWPLLAQGEQFQIALESGENDFHSHNCCKQTCLAPGEGRCQLPTCANNDISYLKAQIVDLIHKRHIEVI